MTYAQTIFSGSLTKKRAMCQSLLSVHVTKANNNAVKIFGYLLSQKEPDYGNHRTVDL